MDRSLSESDINVEMSTPPNSFVSQRPKKRAHGELDSGLSAFSEDFKKDIMQMMSTMMLSQKEELKQISSDIKEIKTVNYNIENSIAFLMQQNKELNDKIKTLESQSKEDKEYITILEDKLEDLQRGMRKACLEIKNVPRKESETKDDLIEIVINLGKSINCRIEKQDIKDITRVPGRKEDKTKSTIIFETSSTLQKTDILKMSKSFNIKNKVKLQAKHLGFTSKPDTPIYVAEQLTNKGARLFFLARDLQKSGKFKYCWTSFGKVLIRKDDSAPVTIIRNEAQIHKLLQSA